MAVHGLSVFLAAFLFFHAQPLLGRHLLPMFGGGPAVWSVGLVFWQGLLLAGYLWAHALLKLRSARAQQVAHGLLCVAAVGTLPLEPGSPVAGARDPALDVLWVLLRSVGLPGLALAATAPLVQAWYAGAFPRRSPYRLYAMSNAASLLALLISTCIADVFLTRARQGVVWTGLFIVYCLALLATCPGRREMIRAAGARTDHRVVALWWLLPFCSAALLVSLTARLTADFAVVPFLWTLPLAVYLFTWMLAFDHPRWYRRALFGRLLPVALLLVWAAALAVRLPGGPGFVVLLPVFLSGLFICCFVCHGELHRLRPDAGELSAFYLAIAGGGFLGSVVVALIAPRLFPFPLELPMSLVLCGALAAAILLREQPPRLAAPESFGRLAYLVGGLTVYVLAWTATTYGTLGGVICSERNFFGVAAVREQTLGASTNRSRVLVHGATIHGLQFQEANRVAEPTTYFGPASGFAKLWPTISRERSVKVGVIGLGTGTLAAYGRGGDRFRFYEINPAIAALARGEFTFLKDSAAAIEIVIGDARVALAGEENNGFDLLVLDAFNGGVVPVHLLTREAFELYLRHLAPNGRIAIHATNKHLDLGRPIRGGAAAIGMSTRHLSSRLPWATVRDTGQRSSDWYLLEFTEEPAITAAPAPFTDEHASLLPLLK